MQQNRSAAALDVIGYVRVSTDMQAESGAGLEAQRQAIEAEVARRGWRLIGVEQDVMSGKALDGRDGLERAIAACERGTASAVVIARLDRLIRSVSDFASLLERSRRQGWQVVALDMAGVDTTTATGEFLATIIAAVAQLERRVIGERTKAALGAKRARGERLGGAPEITPAVEARIRTMRAGGATMETIAEALNAEQVPTARGGRWYPSTIRRVLVRAA